MHRVQPRGLALADGGLAVSKPRRFQPCCWRRGYDCPGTNAFDYCKIEHMPRGPGFKVNNYSGAQDRNNEQ